MVLFVGNQMRIGLKNNFFGVADPSGDGPVVHTPREQIGHAGMPEAVDLDVGEPGELRVL